MRLRGAVCAAALGALACLAWGWHTSAAAHANLRTSDPAPGATLRVAPGAVTLTFTEPPEVSLAQVRVLDQNGNGFERGRATGGGNTLRSAVRPLARGVYTVTWRVVSRADGHATAGAFAFGIGVSPAGATANVPQPKTPPPSPMEIVGRWLFIAGVVIAIGGAAMAALALSRSGGVRTYVVVGAVVALVGVVLLGIAQQRASGAGLSAFLRTAIGRAIVWRAATVAGALVAVLLSRVAGRAAWAVAAVLATVAACIEVAAGHAAAVETYRWLSIATQSAHFVAVGVWVGGLGSLLIGTRGPASEKKASAIARFSGLAGISLAVVAGTGTYRAVVQVRTWSALVSSGYGRVVLAKVVLLGVLAALGARNRYVNVPAVRERLHGFRRVSRAELATGAVILIATAVLAGLSPPPPAALAEQAAPLTASGSDLGHLFRVGLTVRPGFAGSNAFRVRVVDYESRRPADASHVSLRFESADGGVGPSMLDLRESDDGIWRATGSNMSVSGRWTITVRVQGETTSAEIPLEIATRCRTEVLSAGPPTIYSEQVAGGHTAQTYLDPGEPGYNEVHFTFFDAKGTELPIDRNPVITAWRAGSEPQTLEVRRFSSGHFIASGRFAAAKWRFESVATARGSRESLRACFEQTIG